jgi:hypothetical protein
MPLMIALKAHFDGRVLIPDEPLDLPANQQVNITIEPVNSAPAPVLGKRTFLAQPGVITYIAPDFDQYLGDDFWGLNDDKAEK